MRYRARVITHSAWTFLQPQRNSIKQGAPFLAGRPLCWAVKTPTLLLLSLRYKLQAHRCLFLPAPWNLFHER